MQKTRYVFITLAPLLFMCAVTFSAGYLKIFSSDPKLGFLSGAQSFAAQASSDPAKADELLRQAHVWQFDAIVAGFFMLFVFLIVVGSAAQWWQLIRGTKPVVLRESEFVPVSQLELVG
jgi:carbon starvation protein